MSIWTEIKRTEDRLKKEESPIKWWHVILTYFLLIVGVFYINYSSKEESRKRNENPTGYYYVNRYGCVPINKELTGRSYSGGGGKMSRYEMTEVTTTYDCYQRGHYSITEYRQLTYKEFAEIINWGKK